METQMIYLERPNPSVPRFVFNFANPVDISTLHFTIVRSPGVETEIDLREVWNDSATALANLTACQNAVKDALNASMVTMSRYM